MAHKIAIIPDKTYSRLSHDIGAHVRTERPLARDAMLCAYAFDANGRSAVLVQIYTEPQTYAAYYVFGNSTKFTETDTAPFLAEIERTAPTLLTMPARAVNHVLPDGKLFSDIPVIRLN